ncbi:MAG: O-methyltransferase [Candidatus Ancillula sp.]|nr:O-methyltransferase [Candidatus Ancillula sp.]
MDKSTRNVMMDMPIVDARVVEFLRDGQRQLIGELRNIQLYAFERKMPIIPHETAKFLQFLMSVLAPKRVLEVGTAIGFSAGLMALSAPDANITTIDRYGLMIERAKENFKKLGVLDRVTLLEGDAENLLPEMLENDCSRFDFIFLDCAKSKYIEFLPLCLKLLSSDGAIMIDDIFQGGTIFDDESEVRHNRRKIYEGLNALLREVNARTDLISTALPLGDGVLLIKKSGLTG